MTNHQIGRFCLRCSCKPTSQIPTSQVLHLFANFSCNATPWSNMPWKFSKHAHQKLIPPQGVKPAWPGPSIHPLAVIWGRLSIRLCKFHQGKALGMDWEGHSGSSWPQTQPIVKLNKLSGKLTLSRLWSKQNPKVKLVRLLGKIIPSRL